MTCGKGLTYVDGYTPPHYTLHSEFCACEKCKTQLNSPRNKAAKAKHDAAQHEAEQAHAARCVAFVGDMRLGPDETLAELMIQLQELVEAAQMVLRERTEDDTEEQNFACEQLEQALGQIGAGE